jgi:serine/threonine protein kinase
MSSHDDPLRTAPEGQRQPLAPPGPGPAALPSHVGRYRVEGLLGAGGFGRVYLAHDDQLSRPVAVKVQHSDRPFPTRFLVSHEGEASTQKPGRG